MKWILSLLPLLMLFSASARAMPPGKDTAVFMVDSLRAAALRSASHFGPKQGNWPPAIVENRELGPMRANLVRFAREASYRADLLRLGFGRWSARFLDQAKELVGMLDLERALWEMRLGVVTPQIADLFRENEGLKAVVRLIRDRVEALEEFGTESSISLEKLVDVGEVVPSGFNPAALQRAVLRPHKIGLPDSDWHGGWLEKAVFDAARAR